MVCLCLSVKLTPLKRFRACVRTEVFKTVKSRVEKYISAIAGLSLICVGFSLVRSPFIVRKFSGYVIDTTGYNVPLGVFVTVVGAVLAVHSIRAKVTPTRYYICSQCEATYEEGVATGLK